MIMPNLPHPGEFIRDTYLEPFNLDVRQVALTQQREDSGPMCYNGRTPDAGRRTPDAGRRTPDAGRRTPDAGRRTPEEP